MSKWIDSAKNSLSSDKEGGIRNGVKNSFSSDKQGGIRNGAMNKMKGFVGRNETTEDRSSYVAAPLSSLKDPSTFAPPPKRDPTQPIPAHAPRITGRPAPAPPARALTQGSHVARQEEGVHDDAASAPSRGWQLDTTGLSTTHLPPPPGRRDGADGRGASPTNSSAAPPPYSLVQSQTTAVRGPPPSLPPRLPPRAATSSPVRAAPPAIPYRPATQTHLETRGRAENGYLNQGAASRLGAAGISIPGFGIGGKSSPAPPPRSPASPASAETAAASQGTTWQQKQAALRTASQFNKDPSSVSFSDAKSAASTANSFRQRHGEQVAGGLRTANSLGQRFGLAEKARIGDNAASRPDGSAIGQQQGSVSVANLTSAIGKKKAPAPPPPKKKAALSSGPALNGNTGEPPPVPMSTRPKF